MPPQIRKQATGPVSNRPSIFDRIKPIGFDPRDGIKINLYGKPGTGKTTLWSTFPKPILAIICSGSDTPGEMRSIDTEENRNQIMGITLERSLELRELVEHPSIIKYQTVVLDHASGLQDLTLKEILGLKEVPVQLSWGLASQQQYGQLALQMKENLRALLSLRQNVVVIAQEREFNNDGESEILTPFVASGLSPSICGWLNTAVDYICQTFIRQREESRQTTVVVGGKPVTKTTKHKVKGVEFCLRTAPDPTYITKFRIPRTRTLPDVIVDPHYDKLIGLIRGPSEDGK